MADVLCEEEAKVVRYINLYTDNEVGALHKSREEADRAVDLLRTRIACIKVEFVEGKFDD